MGRVLLHLGFLITVVQQLACPAEPCANTSHTQLLAQTGENVSMSCLFPVHDPRKAPKVQWNYRGETESTTVNLYQIRDEVERTSRYQPRFQGRTWVNATGLSHGDATLHLAGVTMSDRGNFSCWVSLGFDCVSVEVQLLVSEHNQQRNLDCGLAATCYPGLVLALVTAVTLCV